MLSDSKNMNDGFFEIKFNEDGIYLTVYPPIGKGKRVEVKDVLEKLNKKQVKSFNKDTVELLVMEADKSTIKIAEPQEEAKLNAAATIMVSPDKMKAFLVLTPPDGGRMLTSEEILDLLNKEGVIYGINMSIIETIAVHPVYNQMICAAEGTLPVSGQNGGVEFHFDVNKDRKPTVLDDGRVDFRELNLVESINKGQLLCTLIPPVPGIKGKTVTGVDVSAFDGKPAVLPKGKNVEISEDGQSLISSIDGRVQLIDGKVSVFATYEVPADVDNSTGNISFVGNVSIRGNVLSGFVVEAGGSVEVWGVVEGAVIKAGGDIILRRGMQGLGKGILISGGDIVARYIEHGNIEAKKDIKAEAIMHSNVKCGNKLELTGRKGLLVGGTCKVGKEIVAKVIGSHMATTTDVEVGVDPSLRERHKALKEEITAIESDIKKADQAVNILRKLESAGMLTPEKQELMVKSVRTKVFYSSKVNELKEELMQVETKLQQDSLGRVRCYNFIYPGTRVSIGSAMIYIKDTLQYCTLYRDGVDIRIGPMDM